MESFSNGAYNNFIGGEWVEGCNYIENINPSNTNDVIGVYSQASRDQVHDACKSAEAEFSVWSRQTAQYRANILDEIGQRILEKKEELGTLLAREEGKPIREAIGEAERAGHIFKFFAGEAIRLGGEVMSSLRTGISVGADRVPIGPVGIITPWNFPIAIPAWKIAPSLAYGCTVVFKPANLVPACAHALTEIFSKCGLNNGEFNLVMGNGSTVGETITSAREISGVSFTGSTDVGKSVSSSCVAHGARFQLEMGGKNPIVVLDDANIERAAEAAIIGAFFQTGQRCTASSRMIVTDGIHDKFIGVVKSKLDDLRIDSALLHDTDIGPAVDSRQYQQDLSYIEVGLSEAKLAWGGKCLERATPDFYIEPALFVETSNEMKINQEEVFGPIASVIRVSNYEEALHVANDTPYGLASSIFTENAKIMNDFRRRSEVGMVMCNLPTAGLDYHAPFGGVKASSYGAREQGTYAREFYTTVKTWYSYDGY
ncbi:aldehyde dehydrogenase family protein [Halomonas salipaludis]|nr:aldehyde dehydrogenase family protein [Halomonas salipaludis]